MHTINGYKEIYLPNHPRAGINGYVYEHILVAEKKLGRNLKQEETVHHIDHCRSNNNPSNLLIFATNADHAAFHVHNQYYLDSEGIAHCNFRKKYYCKTCGKPITNTAKLCVNCWRESEKKVFRPSRDVLKELIREKSFISIGITYKVTDNAIRKWCKTYNLPYKKKQIEKISEEEWEKI